MSDLDLSTALADLADDVDLVDFGARVDRAISQRRHRRTVATVAGTVIAVLAVVGGAIAVVNTGDHSTRSAHHPTPAPTTSSTPLTLQQRLPRYIPPAAHLVREGTDPHHYPTAAAYQAIWQAAGAKIRFSIIDDRELTPCPKFNPADPMAYRTLKHLKLPCGPDTGWLSDVLPLADGYPQSINGETAHVASQGGARNENNPGIRVPEAGIQDVEWREGPFHYVLASNRLTPGGGALTGIPFPQIVKMARSVPLDPSVPAVPALPNPPGVSIPTSALDGFFYSDRELADANGAAITYQRESGDALFTVLVEPLGASLSDTSQLDGVRELYPRLGRHRHVTIRHTRVNRKPAVVWSGPGTVRGMRLHLDGFMVGFYGPRGATIADFKRIASAMTVISHQP